MVSTSGVRAGNGEVDFRPPLSVGATPAERWTHVVTLATAAVVLGWTAKGSQFYYDDWSFIVPILRGEPDSIGWFLQPHNEHWVLLPRLVYAGLHDVLGFPSVYPYLAVTIALHLVLCHQLWRLSLRGGANAWFATVAVVGYALFAAGVENILWDFQMGLIGNMVLGAWMVLDLSGERPRPIRAAVLAALNVMTSGVALVFLVVGAVLVLVQRRPRLLWVFVPASALYVAWYLAFAGPATNGPRTVSELALVPLYWLLGVGNALSSTVPLRSPYEVVRLGLTPQSGLAALGAVAVSVVVILLARRGPGPGPTSTVWVFALGCPVFVALTAFSRISLGLNLAMMSRYTYVSTAFVLPLLVGLATVLARRGWGRVLVPVSVVLVAAANLTAWVPTAREWVSWSSTSSRVVAAGEELVALGAPVYRRSGTLPEFAFLGVDDLALDLPTPQSGITTADRLTASLRLQTRLVPDGEPSAGCGEAVTSTQVSLPAGRTRIVTSDPRGVDLVLVSPTGERSHPRTVLLAPGTYALESLVTGGRLEIAATTGGETLRVCRE